MAGSYPSIDFAISEEGAPVRRVVIHLPTGMTIEASRLPGNPMAVPRVYKVGFEARAGHPQEVVQAALRHLRVWLMREYGIGGRTTQRKRPIDQRGGAMRRIIFGIAAVLFGVTTYVAVGMALASVG